MSVVSLAEGICNLVNLVFTSGTSPQFDKEGCIFTCPSPGFLIRGTAYQTCALDDETAVQ